MLNSSGRLICLFWKAVLSQTPSVVFIFLWAAWSPCICAQSDNDDLLSSHLMFVPCVRYLAVVFFFSMDKLATSNDTHEFQTDSITRLSPRVPLLALRSNLFNDTIAGLWNGRLSSLLLRIPGDCREPSSCSMITVSGKLLSQPPSAGARAGSPLLFFPVG